MKRYSFKIIVAGIKEDIQGICNWLEKDDEYCKDLRESVKTYESRFQVLAAWLYARDIEPEEYILSLQKYINSKKLDPSKIKVSKNAIQINDDKFEDKHIALVDDILTTGATANEISKVLKAAGANRVDVWVCARTPE